MNKKNDRLTVAILETAEDMYKCNLITENTYKKIIRRHLKKVKHPKILQFQEKNLGNS